MHFLPANISLPDFSRTDAERWAVIACDQFTSEPAYWEACRDFVGDAPSTLKMILPEAWLGDGEDARIDGTARTMRAYRDTILSELPTGYVYVERTQSDGRVRPGLVGMIDLEDYDFAAGAVSPIRATEATVVSRIPPRVKIRRDAIYELPHVMLLADDPDDTILSPYAGGQGLTPLYDTPLMAGGGHLTGWRVEASEAARIDACLAALAHGEHPLILAVGDGNHSLATAKTIYEQYKAAHPDEAETSPLRYALAEVVNLHATALDFEPIYRIATGCDPAALTQAFAAFVSDTGKTGRFPGGQVTLIAGDKEKTETYSCACHPLAVGVVDAFLERHPEVKVDYIHGEESLRRLAAAPDALGFLFSGIRKEELFPAVAASGSLPRKTFSMGQARDKRYYMEARLLR